MENSDEDDFPLTEDQMDKLAQLQVYFFGLVKISEYPPTPPCPLPPSLQCAPVFISGDPDTRIRIDMDLQDLDPAAMKLKKISKYRIITLNKCVCNRLSMFRKNLLLTVLTVL
jgi:hypothetical protein